MVFTTKESYNNIESASNGRNEIGVSQNLIQSATLGNGCYSKRPQTRLSGSQSCSSFGFHLNAFYLWNLNTSYRVRKYTKSQTSAVTEQTNCKILDKKPNIAHNCPTLQKHRLLSWKNMVKYSNSCLKYKMIHSLSFPPLQQFVNIRTADHSRTRSAASEDCVILLRKSEFGQTAFSVRSCFWVEHPSIRIRAIRKPNTYSSFKIQLNKSELSTLTTRSAFTTHCCHLALCLCLCVFTHLSDICLIVGVLFLYCTF